MLLCRLLLLLLLLRKDLHTTYIHLITLVLSNHYSEWATVLSNLLQAKQKLGFINGFVSKPATYLDLSGWLATNSMIVGWIRTSIDPTILTTVTFVPEAHKLWESLPQRFSVKSGFRIHLLQDESSNCRQDGQFVQQYYRRLTKLWEVLINLKAFCVCSCDTSVDIEKGRQDGRVHKFLFGLDESRFYNIRSQIIDEDPLRDINKVYSRVIQEEQHNKTTRSREVKIEIIGFMAQSDNSKDETLHAAASWSRDPNRFCIHYSRKGHDNS